WSRSATTAVSCCWCASMTAPRSSSTSQGARPPRRSPGTQPAQCWRSAATTGRPAPCGFSGLGRASSSCRRSASAPSAGLPSEATGFGATHLDPSRSSDKTRAWLTLCHQHVLELPRIAGVEVLGEQHTAAHERGPVGVLSDHWSEVRALDLEAAMEIHLVGLNDAAIG